jgi:hypothetical protein
MEGLSEEKKSNMLLKSLLAGIDSGKRSTFTLTYYFILWLLEKENPKLASSLALSMIYGNQRT